MTAQDKLSETIHRANDLDRQARIRAEAQRRVAMKRAIRSAQLAETEKAEAETSGDEMDDWDGEGSCPKCQGDDCLPETGCIHDE